MTIPFDFIVLLLVIFVLALVIGAVVFLRRRHNVNRLLDLRKDHIHRHKKH